MQKGKYKWFCLPLMLAWEHHTHTHSGNLRAARARVGGCEVFQSGSHSDALGQAATSVCLFSVLQLSIFPSLLCLSLDFNFQFFFSLQKKPSLSIQLCSSVHQILTFMYLSVHCQSPKTLATGCFTGSQ